MLLPLPSADVIELRAYRPEDAQVTLAIFQGAVLTGAAEAYSLAERQAWAGRALDLERWNTRRLACMTWVAEVRGKVVGFCGLAVTSETDGVVDMLYVHPDHTRRGVGTALLQEVERTARELALKRLSSDVSLIARATYERQSFEVMARRTTPIGVERLANLLMVKQLEPDVG